MEVLRQRCQSCGHTVFRDLLVRTQGQPQRVFVTCDHCGAFVARYTLAGYYHHGKGLDSYLRGLGNVVAETGRDFLDEFSSTQAEAVTEFELVKAAMQQQTDTEETSLKGMKETADNSAPSNITPGRYRHFKGGEYMVWDVALHSETEEPLVIYRPVKPNSRWWARPLPMFQEEVEVEGKTVPRFQYVGIGQPPSGADAE